MNICPHVPVLVEVAQSCLTLHMKMWIRFFPHFAVEKGAIRTSCLVQFFRLQDIKQQNGPYTVLLILISHFGVLRLSQWYRVSGVQNPRCFARRFHFPKHRRNYTSACSSTTAVTTNSHCCIEQQWLCRCNLSAYLLSLQRQRTCMCVYSACGR